MSVFETDASRRTMLIRQMEDLLRERFPCSHALDPPVRASRTRRHTGGAGFEADSPSWAFSTSISSSPSACASGRSGTLASIAFGAQVGRSAAGATATRCSSPLTSVLGVSVEYVPLFAVFWNARFQRPGGLSTPPGKGRALGLV